MDQAYTVPACERSSPLSSGSSPVDNLAWAAPRTDIVRQRERARVHPAPSKFDQGSFEKACRKLDVALCSPLTLLGRGEVLSHYKRLWERAYGSRPRHNKGRKPGVSLDHLPESFHTMISARFGMSTTLIFRLITIWRGLSPSSRVAAVNLPLSKKRNWLLAIARLKPPMQAKAIGIAAANPKWTLPTVLHAATVGLPASDPVGGTGHDTSGSRQVPRSPRLNLPPLLPPTQAFRAVAPKSDLQVAVTRAERLFGVRAVTPTPEMKAASRPAAQDRAVTPTGAAQAPLPASAPVAGTARMQKLSVPLTPPEAVDGGSSRQVGDLIQSPLPRPEVAGSARTTREELQALWRSWGNAGETAQADFINALRAAGFIDPDGSTLLKPVVQSQTATMAPDPNALPNHRASRPTTVQLTMLTPEAAETLDRLTNERRRL